jgi:hypothetical protein
MKNPTHTQYLANLNKTAQLIEAARHLKRSYLRGIMPNATDAQINETLLQQTLKRKTRHGNP